MRRLLLALVVLPVVLAAAAAASAQPTVGTHNTQWYWGKGLVQQTLYNEGLYYNDGTLESVDFAQCFGRGKWIWNDPRTRHLYKHFDCYLETDSVDPYWIRFHVTGRRSWVFQFLYYD